MIFIVKMEMFKWKDEFGNESSRYFLKTADCDNDIAEWRQFGYKSIGEHIEYVKHILQLPDHIKLLFYLAAWYMNGRLENLKEKDVKDIVELYILLTHKLSMSATTHVSLYALYLHEYLETANPLELDILLGEIDRDFDYLYDYFIDCYRELDLWFTTSHDMSRDTSRDRWVYN